MLSKIKLGPKLIGGFVIIALIAVVIGIVGIRSITEIGDVLLPSVDSLRAIRASVNNLRMAERTQLIGGLDDQTRQNLKALIKESWDRLNTAWQLYESLPQTKKEAELWRQLVPAYNKWKQTYENTDSLAESGKLEEAKAISFVTGREDYNEFSDLMDRIIQENNNVAASSAKLGKRTMITATIIGFFVALVLGILLTLSITKPVTKMVMVSDKIAQGDIDQNVNHKSGDELGRLADSFRQMVDYIREVANAATSISKGDVSVEIKPRSDRDFLSNSFRQMVDYIKEVANAATSISKGDVSVEIKPRSDQDFLSKSFIQVADTLRELASESDTLSKAAVAGKLDARGNAQKFEGSYHEIIQGVNNTLDAVIQPLNESNTVLAECADGDLTVRMTGNYKGQLSELKNSINTTIESLESAMLQVNSSVNQVASASGQIASGSQSLAEAASEQASSLEEISSSLEELSSMSKQNADNASQAKNLSQEASGSAKAGNDAMEQMNQAINKIKTSSDETAKIIKTIDEIAFQTNLLALNAAVEAARAGEAGKGFAVVAEEVRNLAQRSASAAKDTSDLIQQATENADDGVRISGEVFKTFIEISQSIGKVNDLIAEISAANTEQSQGISQINVAIADMDKITQSNAANSEESASAAQELSAQVSELRSMITKFRMNGNGNGYAKSDAVKTLAMELEPANLMQKKEKKSFAGKANIVPKPSEFFPLDDSELAEF